MLEVPWQTPSRQKLGTIQEQKQAKKLGAKLHKQSGAGLVKHDASTREELIEYKNAKLSHKLDSKYLYILWSRAINMGKEPSYIIYFDNGIVAKITITKETIGKNME